MWRSLLFFLACFIGQSWQQITNTGNYNPGLFSSASINKDALTALSLLASNPGILGGGGGGFGGAAGGFGGAAGGAFGGAFGGAAGGSYQQSYSQSYGGEYFFATPPKVFHVPVPVAVKKKEPLYLTCKNGVEHDKEHGVVVATIGDYNPGYGDQGGYGSPNPYGPGGFGGPGGYGGGPGFGGPGFGGPGGSALSLDITVKSYGVSGPAQVVFTTQGATSTGCYAENLGRIYAGPGGQQALNPYANFLIGFGPPGPVGYGAPGGYGKPAQPGVVTSINLYPDRPSNAHVDHLPIEHLEELAGRGLAVVTSVSFDGYGQTVMDGKIIACCSLNYDNRHRDFGVYPAGGVAGPAVAPGPGYPAGPAPPPPTGYPAGAVPPPGYPAQPSPGYPSVG